MDFGVLLMNLEVSMKYNKIFLLVFIWMTILSCSSFHNNEEVLSTITERVIVSPTPINTTSFLPVVTATQYFLTTPANIPATQTSEILMSSYKLQDAMLTKDDIKNIGEQILLRSSIPEIFIDDSTAVMDISQELIADCLLDCTKQIWVTASHEVTGFNGQKVTDGSKVIIAMILSSNEEGAKRVANGIYNGFLPFEIEYRVDDYPWVNANNADTHIGFQIVDQKRSTVVITVRGTVSIMVIYYSSPLSDDGIHDIEVVTNFLNVQIKKLENLRIIPTMQ